MADNIWVVVRSQGEWSDRSETCACWFPSQVAAEGFVARAGGESRDAAQRWRAIEDAAQGEIPDETYRAFIEGLSILDKGFDPAGVDADSVNYFVREVPRGAI